MSRKLHVVNLPPNMGSAELNKAIQQVCQTAKCRVYTQNNQSLRQGDITFQLVSDKEDFLRRVKVQPIVVESCIFRFVDHKDGKPQEAQQQQSTPRSLRLAGHLASADQKLSEQELLTKLHKVMRQITTVSKKQIVTNSKKTATANVIVYIGQPDGEPDKIIKRLAKYGQFRIDTGVDVKNTEELEHVRVLIRNLPNLDDEELTAILNRLIAIPFRHVKHVKNFCFVTFYSEEDAVNVVKSGQILFGTRPLVPDFTSDEMRTKYQNFEVAPAKNEAAQEEEEPSAQSISVPSVEEEPQEDARVVIEEFDKNKNIADYINEPQNSSEEELFEDEEEEENEDEQLKQMQEFVKTQPKDAEQTQPSAKAGDKFQDSYTVFVQGVPTFVPLDALNATRKEIESKGITPKNDNHLIEMCIRRHVANLFLQFGPVKKVALPLDPVGKLRGTAFVQFEREGDYATCLEYVELLRTLKTLKPSSDGVQKQAQPFSKLIGEVKLADSAQDPLMQQVAQQRALNGYEQLKAVDHNLEKLDLIKRISRKSINVQAGMLRLFEANLMVLRFESNIKKRLEREAAALEKAGGRNEHLFKFGLKIPGTPDYKTHSISKSDEEYRVRYYHRQKHLLTNVNFHVNPMRVELRNFNKNMSESAVLALLWLHLVSQKGLVSSELAYKHLTGPIYSGLRGVKKWSDILDPEVAKKQEAVSLQQLDVIRETLKLITIRIPRAGQAKCFELFHNFNQVMKTIVPEQQLSGMVFFETEGEEASKRLIELLDNSSMFGKERKPLCCFVVENVGKIKERRAWSAKKESQ